VLHKAPSLNLSSIILFWKKSKKIDHVSWIDTDLIWNLIFPDKVRVFSITVKAKFLFIKVKALSIKVKIIFRINKYFLTLFHCYMFIFQQFYMLKYASKSPSKSLFLLAILFSVGRKTESVKWAISCKKSWIYFWKLIYQWKFYYYCDVEGRNLYFALNWFCVLSFEFSKISKERKKLMLIN